MESRGRGRLTNDGNYQLENKREKNRKKWKMYKKHFAARMGLGHDELARSATKCLINKISYNIFSIFRILKPF
jgi:hypothetical protein